MTTQKQLQNARKCKKDEFYTPADVVESGLSVCGDENLRKVTLYAPCDTMDSEFVKYARRKCGGVMYSEREDGGYRGHTHLAKTAGLIATNPPFSLGCDFLHWLLDDVQRPFLILMNLNTLFTPNLIRYVVDKRVTTLGNRGARARFYMSEHYPAYGTSCRCDSRGQYAEVPSARWVTNILRLRPHTNTWENAPESLGDVELDYISNGGCVVPAVRRRKDVPKRFEGELGVPITWYDLYDPEHYEVVALWNTPSLDGKAIYKRLIIRCK